MSGNDRDRPVLEAASNVTDGDESSVVRCACCGRPLTRPESIDAGRGWRCLLRGAM